MNISINGPKQTEIYSFHNLPINVPQHTNLIQQNYLPYFPNSFFNNLFFNNSIQELIPITIPQQINSSAPPEQNIQVSYQYLNSQTPGDQPKLIINYTIINNFPSKNKKKEKIEIVEECDDSTEPTESLTDNKKIDEFVESIRRLVDYLERNDGEHSVLNKCLSFGISKRRIYDIINVFTAIGCCGKNRCDSVFWIGQSNIRNQFRSMIEKSNIDDYSLTLDELFPTEKYVGFSSMTTSFVLLFYVLRRDRLDIKDAALFFSKDKSRYKVTLNKLYQIVHIMSAIKMMRRTDRISEVAIETNAFVFDVLPEKVENDKGKMRSIQVLLNNNESKLARLTQRRRDEYNCFVSNMKK